MLKVFSTLLLQFLKPGDIAGRLGGDEFAVLITHRSDTDAFLHALRQGVEKYNEHSGKPYNINFSSGVLHNDPDKYASLDEMIKKSDEVMYSVKRRRQL